MSEAETVIDRLGVRCYEIPTDRPESDGTLSWDSTTIVIVHAHSGDHHGLGYTYGPRQIAGVVTDLLAPVVCGIDALSPPLAWEAMHAALRNAGQSGIGAMALSAVDLALHDLRARLLGLSLAQSIGRLRDGACVYGSGGFTTYGPDEVAEQLGDWVGQGIARVKMKVGRRPDEDPARLAAARQAIGSNAELMVDANGAFSADAAIAWADRYADYDVVYLEEPVTQDDVAGLRHVREQSPVGMAIASGEYSWGRYDTHRLIDADAVDIVQADVTRCGGMTELARIDALCATRDLPLSLHCAPAISAHVACTLEQFIHLEYFHDHVRIEQLLFDGVLSPVGGALAPDLSRPGHGLELKAIDAERHSA